MFCIKNTPTKKSLYGSVSFFEQAPVVVKTVRLTSVLLDVLNIQDVTQPRKDCL